jgi:hypothetical protein
MGINQLADIVLQCLFCHAKLTVRVEQFHIQDETVRTGQVAGGARGLG